MANDRGGEAQRAGDLVSALLGGPWGKGLGEAQRAARAWYAANGDRERSHTTGVWLRSAGRADVDPVMVVEVDANWLAGELSTNKDLYLSRISMRGVRVSDIRFQVGRRRSSEGVLRPKEAKDKPSASRAPLSPAELERIERACADLPDGLRQSTIRAMAATLQRHRSETA